MRKSNAVTLVILGIALTGCSRGPVWDREAAIPKDPCAKETFDPDRCQDAVRRQGYHYGGAWYPMFYSQPYQSYYGSHMSYANSGGRIVPVIPQAYGPTFRAPSIGSRVTGGTVTRGGFGSSFSSHGVSS